MANQSVQPVQIKSTPANALYHPTYNSQVYSGFATVNTVQKKEKASISSIFNWKKDKIRTTETPTLCTSYQSTAYPIQGIQYATTNSNYIIDSNRKLMHYNSVYKPPDAYMQPPFPSTIHATIRYLPNHKQRTNVLATNWEPAIAYPHHSSNGQPITFQHEITYSEQITIAPSCHLTRQCGASQACGLTNRSQSCKCQHQYTVDKPNYFLIPTNSSLLESSNKLHNKSTDCMAKKQSKHSSIRGSKSHHNLNSDQITVESSGTLVGKKTKGTKLAATVNERFLRIFKKSIREPFSTKKSRKSILDCDLTAYDLVEEEESKENIENLNDKLDTRQSTDNLDSSVEDEDQFESNFIQAKAKQKQHFYPLTFNDQSNQLNQVNRMNQINEKTPNYSNVHKDKAATKANKDEEDRWANRHPFGIKMNTSTKGKFNSCRIAGQGMQFSKRMSILESDLCKEFLKEEQSEDEDQNRFDRYAQNFEQLDRAERMNYKLNRINHLNSLNNFRMVNSPSVSHNSIPNLPDPDYDNDEDDRSALTLFSRSTPDLDQTTEQERCKLNTTFTNTTSLFNLDSTSLDHRPVLPPRQPKTKSQQLTNTQSNQQSTSPTSSTYSSFNSSINSNVKSILKKSNSNLALLDRHLNRPPVELNRTLKRNDSKINFIASFPIGSIEDETRLRSSLTKSVTTFKSSRPKKLDDYKPKKQVHFRSSFNDELIVEHIDNQEEEQIYDDILTARSKPTANDIEEEHVRKRDEFKSYSNRSLENTRSSGMLTNRNNQFLSTGKLNALKEQSQWENQSSQLPKSETISHASDGFDRYLSCSALKMFQKVNATCTDELRSTALVKQSSLQNIVLNRSQVVDSTLYVRQTGDERAEGDKNSQSECSFVTNKSTDEKSLEQSSTQSTESQQVSQSSYSKVQSNQLTNGYFEEQSNNNVQMVFESSTNLNNQSSNSFREDLFNQQVNNDSQQMSPSSSSTSAYVSLYATSSFSSACSSSSNYSTSGFNENSKEFSNQSTHSNDSAKKISRSAILDSLINRTHQNKLDKPFNKSLLEDSSDKQEKENKIVIDVANNNSGNYDLLNQSMQNEHIYEELESCGFEREINIIDNVNSNLNSVKKSIFNGASKDEILGYLVDAKERIQELLINNYNEQYSFQQKFSSLSTSCHNIASSTRAHRRVSNLSNVSSDSSSSSDILITNSISNSIGQQLERNDSGVGTETSKPSSLDIRISKSEACLTELIDNHIVRFDDPTEDESRNRNMRKVNQTTNDSGAEEQICADCDEIICAEINKQTGQVYYPLLCSKCHKRRIERKEIISEFVETEFKYGRDLRIIREEFYRPIEIAGLLTKDQMKGVFLNLEELIQVNSKFSEKLQDGIDIATEQGDEDYYTTVDIGKLFMEFSNEMMKSFQTYCIKQASASRLLGQLEKDKEFLRIFLRVSQMENVLLRRMNLSAFLMVPVQRVTKYPLLLNRLFKVTPYHADRGKLKEAQLKVEMHLEQINQQTKGTAPNNSKIWRRISNLSNNSTSKRSNLDELGDVKLKKFNSSVRDLFKAFKSRT